VEDESVITVAPLAKLWLNSNEIGDTGVAALADALKVNTMLRTLVLSNNQARWSGGRQ